MSQTKPGWYNDGTGWQRYWDGNGWTEHVASPPTQPAPASALPKSRKGMPAWGWVLLASGVVVIVGGLAALGAAVMHAQKVPIVAAHAAIETYDSAWVEADCVALAEATTVALRKDLGYDDCDKFVADANDFDEANRNYTTKILSSSLTHGEVKVKTSEAYITEDGTPTVSWVTYTLVKDREAWRIDQIAYAESDVATPGGVQDA
jgi:hypothetical protein